MAKKKKKAPPLGKIQPADLVARAEEDLRQQRYDEAIRWLLRAESDLQRQQPKGGGKTGSPIGVGELRPPINTLLAQAFFSRALSSSELSKKVPDLEEAVKRAPLDGQYLLALGTHQLSVGELEKAMAHLQKAYELSPDHRLAERGWLTGLLASGHTREVKDWFRQQPPEKIDAGLTRLRAIRELTVGNLEVAGTLLGCTPPPTLSHQSNDAPQGAAVRAEREVKAEGSPDERLICKLLMLVAGDQEQAIKQLAELPLPGHNPSPAEAAILATQLFYSGVLHFQAKSFEDAVLEFGEGQRLAREQALNLPWSDRLAPYYHAIAEELITADISTAIVCWQYVLEINPGDKQAHANLEIARRIEAARAWHEGRYEQAVNLWQEGLQHNSQDETLLRNVAIGYEKVGRKDQAVAHWRKLVQMWRPQMKSRQSDEQFQKRLLQAEKHLVDLMLEIKAPIQEIQKEVDAALKIAPDNIEMRRLSVEIYLGLGRSQQALKQIEALERIQGESVELLLLKGVTLSMLNRRQPAKRSIQRAYELDPSNPVARQAYLLLLGQESADAHDDDDLERAADICQQQLAIDSKYRPALSHLACLYFHLDEPRKAHDAIARIIELDPHKAENHAEAGSIYLKHEHPREAEAQFKKALELNPDAQSYLRIGKSYLDADKTKKALKYFDRAAETGSFLTVMEIADTLHEADEDHEAEKYLDLAMEKDPAHPLPHLLKASLLADRTEMEKALQQLAEVERLGAGKAEYQEFVEDARSMKKMLKEMDEFEQMLRGMEKSSGLGPMPPEIRRMLKRLGAKL